MKRDLDLIRVILLDIEAHSEPKVGTYVYATADPASVAFNVGLMLEHGLIDARTFTPLSGYPSFHNVALTWAGSDFLDAVRDDGVWKQTKLNAAKVGSFTFDLLKQIAVSLVKVQLEKYTVLKLGS